MLDTTEAVSGKGESGAQNQSDDGTNTFSKKRSNPHIDRFVSCTCVKVLFDNATPKAVVKALEISNVPKRQRVERPLCERRSSSRCWTVRTDILEIQCGAILVSAEAVTREGARQYQERHDE